MPCWELFEEQNDDYRYEVLLEDVPIVGVEAGISLGWERYADLTVTIDRFGASAPGDVAMKQFGFTAANVESVARSLLL
jgi:transketolase